MLLDNRTGAIVDMVQRSSMPASFAGDHVLLAINLFVMTAMTYLGVGVVLWMGRAVWVHRKWDRWRHPITLYRLAWLCAGLAMALRCGTEAANLWAWDPHDASTAAIVIRVKRFVDPVALMFAWGWMMFLALTYDAMCIQLRKEPLPVRMTARVADLKKPALIVLGSFVMSVGAVWLKG